jgi:hypothetical protein
MCEVIKAKDGVSIRESRGRSVSFVLEKSGNILVCTPSGTAGMVRKIVRMTRDETREVARSILDMLGDQDQ